MGDITTSVADCLRVSIIADSTDRTPIGTFPGHTLLVTHSAASAGTLSIQYKALPTAGTDTGVSTTQGSTYWTTHTFAIAPAASGDQSITVTDSGAGSDSLASVTVSLALTDTGAGNDAFGASATLAATDTGAGTDAITQLLARSSWQRAALGRTTLPSLRLVSRQMTAPQAATLLRAYPPA